jgi:hypothetical protein
MAEKIQQLSLVSKQLAELSSKIATLCQDIERLERNKRQPLELFTMYKDYKKLNNEYSALRAIQDGLIKEMEIYIFSSS